MMVCQGFPNVFGPEKISIGFRIFVLTFSGRTKLPTSHNRQETLWSIRISRRNSNCLHTKLNRYHRFCLRTKQLFFQIGCKLNFLFLSPQNSCWKHTQIFITLSNNNNKNNKQYQAYTIFFSSKHGRHKQLSFVLANDVTSSSRRIICWPISRQGQGFFTCYSPSILINISFVGKFSQSTLGTSRIMKFHHFVVGHLTHIK